MIQLPVGKTVLIFVLFTIMLYIATHLMIPLITEAQNILPIVSWFIAGGILVFVPLFFSAILLARREEKLNELKEILCKLNLKSMSRDDLKAAFIGLISVYILSAAIVIILETADIGFTASPGFMMFDGFKPGEYWMLLIWLPFFFFNIFGEELMWRGYILPRQKKQPYYLILHSVLWGVFHLSFGFGLLITLIPTLIIVPYAVDKTGNTWVGIIIHGVFNGSGFLLLAFNLI
jgi:membrane protease YdiL (CAAX protease family)